LKRFSKNFPIEVDVEMLNPNVALIAPGDHELNKIDSALYQEQASKSELLWYCGS
jgi:hypothetical protein